VKVMLALTALLLAGCAASPPAATAGAGHRVQPNCAAPTESPETVTLAGFTVSWVLLCPFRINKGPRLTERADGPATDLVRQLETPNDPPPENGACTDELISMPFFALVDAAGDAIAPMVPTGPCGQPKKAVRDALAALPFRVVKSENG
jgi:hypothetical protein